MLEQIEDLVEAGWAVHLLKPESKAPVGNDWSKAPVLNYDQLVMRYRDGMNVGVRLGEVSKVDGLYLHAFDVDIKDEEYKDEAWKALKRLFPGVKLSSFPTVQSGSGGESRHVYFLSERPFLSKKLAFSDGTFVSNGTKHRFWEIELFGTGKQVALPPSIHPISKKAYRWIIDPQDGIPEIDAYEIEDALAILDEENQIGDQDTSVTEITYAEAEKYLAQLNLDRWCEDREGWRNVGMALHHEFGGREEARDIWTAFSKQSRKYDKKVLLQQWRSFKEEKGRAITFRSIIAAARREGTLRALEEWIDGEDEEEEVESTGEEPKELTSKSVASMFDDLGDDEDRPAPAPKKPAKDPDMTLIHEVLGHAPKFPLDLFGERLQAVIEKLAVGTSSSEDFIVASFLACASAAIGNSNRVVMKDGYNQPLSIWALVVGNPSSLKSPAMRPAMNALIEVESSYEPGYQRAKAAWDVQKLKADLAKKQYEKLLAAILSKGEDVSNMNPPDACKAPPAPVKRLMVLNDATIEAFTRQQELSKRGFLVFRDEIAAWLGQMTRYKDAGGGSDRSQWLEAYDGGQIKIARMKDGDDVRVVNRIFAPVLGGIQPDKLLEVMDNGGADDGFEARWWPFWPDSSDRKPLNEVSASNAYFMELYRALATLEMDSVDGELKPFMRPLSEEARQAFVEWSNSAAEREKHSVGRMSSAYGKARGHVLRMAGLLELIWWAVSEVDDDMPNVPKEISLEAMKGAIRFREDYLVPMQMRMFNHSNITEDRKALRAVASWIVVNRKKTFSLSMLKLDAKLPEITRYTKGEVIEEMLAYLTAKRWITKGGVETSSKGGRPREVYTVNPRIWELL